MMCTLQYKISKNDINISWNKISICFAKSIFKISVLPFKHHYYYDHKCRVEYM